MAYCPPTGLDDDDISTIPEKYGDEREQREKAEREARRAEHKKKIS